MPQPNYSGGNPGFFQNIHQVHNEQTHADELNGAVDRGLFIPGITVVTHGIFGEASVVMDWAIKVIIPTPTGGLKEYTLATVSASTYIANNDRWEIPKGGQIKVTTNNVVGANPRTSMVTKIPKEPF